MKSARGRIDVNLEELDRVLDGAREAPLSEADHDKLKEALHALAAMLVRPRNTEKTSEVLEKPEGPEAGAGTQANDDTPPPPGHGRKGAEAFGGARKVDIKHQKLTHGDRCPECGKGNVYGQKEPKVLVRIIGQAPLHPITPTPGVTGTPDERLRLHQERSRPAMDRLHAWLEAQLDERRTEPNSGLGQAISYLLRHWQPLTLFLRKAGAPLDNNVVERALKRAVLHRKNALFYRTLNGAQVGDLFMSLIHTCQLCGANSFDYLVELQRHARELAARPTEWMPWNYRQTLARTMPLPDPA
jgi:hypothetical protein